MFSDLNPSDGGWSQNPMKTVLVQVFFTQVLFIIERWVGNHKQLVKVVLKWPCIASKIESALATLCVKCDGNLNYLWSNSWWYRHSSVATTCWFRAAIQNLPEQIGCVVCYVYTHSGSLVHVACSRRCTSWWSLLTAFVNLGAFIRVAFKNGQGYAEEN